MDISLNAAYSPPIFPLELSKRSSILHWPDAFLFSDPLKMTSTIDSPLRFFAESSPSTHLTASITFDLPHPLGPTTPTKFVGKDIFVGSTKLLKPASFMCLSCIAKSYFVMNILNYCYFFNHSFELIL